MILALDDDVPEAVSEAIRAQEAVRDLWTIRLGADAERAVRRHGTVDPGRPRRDPRPSPARRVDSHRRGSLPGAGRDAADGDRASTGGAWRERGWLSRTPRLPCPYPSGRRSRSSTRLSAGRARRLRPSRPLSERPRAPSRGARTPASSRSARASGRDFTGPRSPPATARSSPAGAARRWSTGRPAANCSPTSSVRVRPALATILERLADGRQPGSHDRSQVPGHGDAPPDHRWSVVVAHDGVFKIALLTLFDLPIDRFWMWTMDLCGISVVELRAGRPVLRLYNSTAHLAPLAAEAGRSSHGGGRGAEPKPRHADGRGRCRRNRRACRYVSRLGGSASRTGQPDLGSAPPANAASRRGRSRRRRTNRSKLTRNRRCAALRAASRSSPRITWP